MDMQTTLCQAWAITRADGVVLGFTDHDHPLAFDGISFRADSGLTARAFAQTTGLSVDNTESMGVLSDTSLSAADIEAGRYDNAQVRVWRVNWRDPAQRLLRFRGTIGEIRRNGHSFQAELRGLSERLNQPMGRALQASCPAVLGDAACGVDALRASFSATVPLTGQSGGQVLNCAGLGAYAPGWFAQGRVTVMSGTAKGLSGVVRHDKGEASREVTLWQALRAPLEPGDMIRLTAGCDKRLATCRAKFGNTVNFRGFPYIPGEDWLIAAPQGDGRDTGGRLR